MKKVVHKIIKKKIRKTKKLKNKNGNLSDNNFQLSKKILNLEKLPLQRQTNTI